MDVYLYLGHSSDACDKKGNLRIKTVPPGSIYITAGVCGLLTRKPGKFLPAFADKNNETIWQNPTVEGLQKALEGVIDTSTIHIHKPGDTYVDSFYNPVSYHYFDKNGKWISILNEKNTKRYKLKASEMKKNNAEWYMLEPSGMYRLSDVLKVKPENLPNEKWTYRTSKNEENTNNTNNTDNTENNNENNTDKNVNYTNNNQEISFKIDPENVFSSYRYAVYPKIEEGEMQLNNSAGYFTPFDMEFISDLGSIYASELMEQFPGIHYNLLCRNVDPKCQKAALARRVDSAEKFQTHPGTFTRTLEQNINETVRNYFQTMFEGKQRPIKMLSEYYEKLPVDVIRSGAHNIYIKQLAEAAKSQIQSLDKSNNFSVVKEILDKIPPTSLFPFLNELDTLCRDEAKKSNGRKNLLLKECLEYIEEQKRKNTKNKSNKNKNKSNGNRSGGKRKTRKEKRKQT